MCMCVHAHVCVLCVYLCWWRLLCWEWKGQTWFLWSHLRDVGILLPSPLRLESFKETGGTQDPHVEKSATMHCWHTAVSRMRKGVQGTETCISWLPRKDPIGPRYNTEWEICPETILQWWRHSFYSAPHRVTCHMRLVTPEMWPLWPRTDFYILFHFKYLQ